MGAMNNQEKTVAYNVGHDSYYSGMTIEENPYTGKKYEEWLEGWYDAYELDMSFQEFDMYWYDTGE